METVKVGDKFDLPIATITVLSIEMWNTPTGWEPWITWEHIYKESGNITKNTSPAIEFAERTAAKWIKISLA